jgi:hypothetical protein
MTSPSLPVTVDRGWPLPRPGTATAAQEVGVGLGEGYPTGFRGLMQATEAVVSVRLDQPAFGTVSEWPNGNFKPSVSPLLVPGSALHSAEEFQRWAWDTHGSVGRLLLAAADGEWWAVNDSDLEVLIVSGDRDVLVRAFAGPDPENSWPVFDPPLGSWLPRLTEYGSRKVRSVAALYGLRCDPDVR